MSKKFIVKVFLVGIIVGLPCDVGAALTNNAVFLPANFIVGLIAGSIYAWRVLPRVKV